jgi:nitrate reductase gamma subunit
MSDTILFVAFPYVAIVLAIWGGVHRYRHDRFSYSTLSSFCWRTWSGSWYPACGRVSQLRRQPCIRSR